MEWVAVAVYLLVGLVYAVGARWAAAEPIGIGTFIGYWLTGGMFIVLVVCLVIGAGIAWAADHV